MGGRLQLDSRLAALAQMVRPGSVVADIGSDHGYLVAWLVKNGVCPRGYACDIHEQPLERSRLTALRYGVADRIQMRLGPGLSRLREGEVQEVVIAGMGGEMIARILADADWGSSDIRYLLQPMTRADELRRWLYANGYEIGQERAVRCKRFLYTLMRVSRVGSGRGEACSDLFAAVGKLPEHAAEEERAYIRRQAKVVQEKAQGLLRSRQSAHQAEPLLRLKQEILATIGEETP